MSDTRVTLKQNIKEHIDSGQIQPYYTVEKNTIENIYKPSPKTQQETHTEKQIDKSQKKGGGDAATRERG